MEKKRWIVEVKELQTAYSQYVVSADTAREARRIMRNQDHRHILDKLKEVTKDTTISHVIKVEEF